MAWGAEDRFGPHRWQYFSFFKTFTLNQTLSESIDIEGPWLLEEIRVHCSVAIASVKYLQAVVSAANGSAYNTILISQDMNTVQDIFLHYSNPVLFMSGDQLNVRCSMISTANYVGVQVTGWAVIN